MNLVIYRKASGDEILKAEDVAVADDEMLALQVQFNGHIHEMIFYVKDIADLIYATKFKSPPVSDRITRRKRKILE